MKTRNLFLGLIAISFLSFVACEKDEEPIPAAKTGTPIVIPPADTTNTADTTSVDTTSVDTVVVVPPHPYEIDKEAMAADTSDFSEDLFLLWPCLIEDDPNTMQVVRLHFRYMNDVNMRKVYVDIFNMAISYDNDTTVTLEGGSYSINAGDFRIRSFSGANLGLGNDETTDILSTKMVDSVSVYAAGISNEPVWIRINGKYFMNRTSLEDLMVDFTGEDFAEFGYGEWEKTVPELARFAIVNKIVLPTKIQNAIDF
jgi:hypothetical protein